MVLLTMKIRLKLNSNNTVIFWEKVTEDKLKKDDIVIANFNTDDIINNKYTLIGKYQYVNGSIIATNSIQ